MTKRVIVFFIFLSLAILTSSFNAQGESKQKETKESTALFPVVQDRKVGYVDKTGKIAIEPRFDDAGPFSEGLAPVAISVWRFRGLIWIEKKFGFIDRTGKIVIKPQFDCALPFSRGLARVDIGNKWDYWGYIDKTGKYIWAPTR